jgi:archaellum component FlaF (FlaF/FlaG flagellin family)
MVENMLTEIGNIYPDREIIIETNNGSVSTKLSKANIFVDGDGNLVVDAE